MSVSLPGFSIRLARASDVPELARLFGELGYDVPPPVLAERLERFTNAGEQAFVAADVSSDRLLGVATLHATPVLHRAGPVGRVTALVVDEPLRGRGIGRALMKAAEQWAAERGCILLEVTSNRRRVEAHQFYEGLGFERTSYRFAMTPRADEATAATMNPHDA